MVQHRAWHRPGLQQPRRARTRRQAAHRPHQERRLEDDGGAALAKLYRGELLQGKTSIEKKSLNNLNRLRKKMFK